MGEEEFGEGGRVGDVIRGAVLGEQEGGDVCGAGVVVGGGPEFEEVEEGEDGEKEGGGPEVGVGGCGCEEEVQGEREGEDEDGAEEEGAYGDAGEGFAVVREVLRVVGVEGGGEVGLVEGGGGWRGGVHIAVACGCGRSPVGRWEPRTVLMLAGDGRPIKGNCRWLHGRGMCRCWGRKTSEGMEESRKGV